MTTPACDTPVLVVGAGPTGLVLACELARRGVDCRVIDSASAPSEHSKALGVMSRTLEVLEDLGVSARMVARGVEVREVRMWSETKPVTRFRLDLLADRTRYPFLLVLPQSETEKILLERLADLGGIVERRKTLVKLAPDEHGVVAHLEHKDGATETVRAAFVVGCDGAHSTVRHELGLPFEGRTYEEGFLLADVAIEWDKAPGTIHTALGPAGAGAAMPLPGGAHHRLIFPVGALPEDGPLPTPSLDRIREIFRERLDPSARIAEAIWISAFRVHRRIVPDFRAGPAGRVFVAGDAAHIHSPAGAQGMNLGVQDAHNLAWKLALVVRDQAADATRLLDSYRSERRPIAEATLGGTGAAQFLLSLQNPAAKVLRNALVGFVTRRRFVMRRLLTSVLEIGVRYPQSAFVAGSAAGVRPADASAQVASGGHAVLGLLERDAAAIEARFAGTVTARRGTDARGVVVLRPDGYIGFAQRRADPAAVARHLAATLATAEPAR